MNEESRHQRQLRILASGIAGPEDFEEAKYLIDMSYAEGSYQLSKMRDSYGEVRSAVIRRISSSGLDYVDWLRVEIAKVDPDASNHGQAVKKAVINFFHGVLKDAAKKAAVSLLFIAGSWIAAKLSGFI